MAQDLTLYDTSVSVTDAARRLGRDRARYLVPDYPAWGATILGAVPMAPPPLAAALLDAVGIASASNSWVLGP
ncbi:MAG: hypothetical protein GWM90_32575, partial [Gemmatimonadetes bacterium]|nr:hypothetical protein [Gemmatimonadota bacterium]NIQ60020.1 hypothetical protein [Gemmatimonadota bacterium]NIU80241.1 hypothetical protein [Gammaproteobacteria bacterium]NIX48624.1 hypothetical protein [Gemmatimonadota bacterium]